jgi:hypothetical protein
MNKLLLLLPVLFPIISFSQSTVYHPFPQDSVIWREDCGGLGFSCNCSCAGPGSVCLNESNRQYYYGTDTVINGTTYHNLYSDYFSMDYWFSSQMCSPPGCNAGPVFYSYTGTYEGAIRDDVSQKKVFLFPEGGTAELLLYDFDLQLGDTLGQTLINWPTTNRVNKIDSVLIGSEYHRRFWLVDINMPPPGPQDSGYVALIEGIGSTLGLLDFLFVPFEFNCNLICVSIDSATVYSVSGSSCTFMTSGINEPAVSSLKIVAAPNPFHDLIKLSWGQPVKQAEIALYNNLGTLVLWQKFENAESLEFNLENYSAGIYAVSLTFDGIVNKTIKVVSVR